jgi:hypothetical protein
VTSIADPASPRRGLSWLRGLLLVAVLGLFARQTPVPWAGLWLGVPAAVAVAMLLSWRFGRWGLIVPAALAVAALALGPRYSLIVWWAPVAAACGAWMGLREEGGGPSAGARAWMLAPLLMLAASLPWSADYEGFTARVERELQRGDREMIDLFRQLGYQGERLAAVQRSVDETAPERRKALPHVLPTFLFLWIALLVFAGRALSSRAAGLMRWPAPSRLRLHEWRLPDAALWVFLLGLALLVAPWPAWMPTGWTLLINTGLGFCVQGIAVVESVLLARGVPSSIIALTMLFMLTVAMPVFVVAAAAVGLSDVWLDYRRIEPAPDERNDEEN